MDSGQPLVIYAQHWRQMREDVSRRASEEACGLVAGWEGHSQAVYPIANSLHSPVRFLMEPAEQVASLLDMEDHGWELLAIYHSHPCGPTAPSSTDVAESYYPGTAQLIWFPMDDGWSCRAFLIHQGLVTEFPLRIAPDR
jgi:proteasome lid subunit RPN8/RPN11